MRRFELSDGASHKFWEVSTDGAEITTRWGRIGTQGQTKTKALATVAKADAEMAKQIAAKTKKGYAEVATSASAPAGAAATPPPAEPATKAPASEPEGAAPATEAWPIPSSWKARLHPMRGGHFVPKATNTLAKDWSDLRERLPELSETLGEGFTLALAQDLWQRCPRENFQTDSMGTLLIRVAAQTLPLTDVMQLLTHPRVVANNVRSWDHAYPTHGARWLRRRLCTVDDATYTAARAVADGWVLPHADGLRAYLFAPDPSWQAVQAQHPSPWLLTCSHDVPALLDSLDSVWWYTSHGLFETWAVELRAHAVPLFVALFDRDPAAEIKKSIAGVLVHIPHDDARVTLLERASDRHVMAQLSSAIDLEPAAYLRLAAPRPKVPDALLRGWLAAHGSAWASVREGLTDAAQARGDALLAALGPDLPDAAAEHLPAWFADPPWHRKKKAKKPVVLELEADVPGPYAQLTDAEQVKIAAALEEAQQPATKPEGRQLHRLRNQPGTLYALARLEPADSTQFTAFVARYLWGDTAERFMLLAASLDPEWADVNQVRWRSGYRDRDFAAGLTALAGPHTAQWALRALRSKRDRARGLAWAARHPDYAARAWIPAVLGSKGKDRRDGEEALRRLGRELGHEAVLEAAKRYGADAEAAVAGIVALDPLDVLPAKRPPLAFLNLGALPRPKLADREEVLPLEAVDAVARVLAYSPLDEPYAGLPEVKALLDPTSLADFGWALFEQWQTAGAPSKDGWALAALGHVGDDRIASQLTPLIRAWPGQSQHQRAVTGLDVLLHIGSELALMHLNGVAQKVKFKGIKSAAQERIAALAEQRGLTQEALADRLVPDLGLDAQGSMVLDYGPRQFTVGFDEALKPFVRDDAGKARKSLPKPGKKDDPAKAEPAEARFKQLKKDVRTLAKLQLTRLEAAMVAARRWTPEDFERFLVNHPLMIHLVRRVVWATFEGPDTVGTAFRVADDRTLADVEDEPFSLDPSASVGIAHPLHLDADTLAAWTEVFSDYEILQPFPQLGRAVFRLTEEEARQTRLERHRDTEVAVGRVMGLMNQGWERGEPLDAGVVHWMDLPLPGRDHVVRLLLGGAGLWTGAMSYQDDNPTIDGVVVVKPQGWDHKDKGEETLGSLPASVASEVLATLERLAAD